MPNPNYTPHVGTKFYADGRVRAFPGNSVICFVDPDAHTTVFQETLWAQQQFQAMHCAAKFSFLPPESFHMTVMDLVCDQVRQAEKWTPLLPLSAPLSKVDQLFSEALADLPASPTFKMQYRGANYTLNLKPADADSAETLRHYRNQVSMLTGVRAPDHDSYGFHISLFYRLIHLTAAEQAEYEATCARVDARLKQRFGLFEPSAPTLVFFDDMFAFWPLSQYGKLTTR